MPEEFLASQGLSKRGAQWRLDEGPALAAAAAVGEVERKYKAASAATAEDLKPLLRKRAQFVAAQLQADQAQSRGQNPPAKVQQVINELGPKFGGRLELGSNAELRALLMERNGPRSELLLAVLKARQLLDASERKYAALAGDTRVSEALSKLPGQTVGSPARLADARKKLGSAEALVLTDEMPLYLQGQDPMLSVVVNESAACELAYLPRQDFNMIPEALTTKLGIAIDPAAPRATIESTVAGGKKQEISCRIITIPSIRLGRHVLKDKEFLVTGPEGAEIGAGLGSRAFAGFRIDPDFENFVLKIQPVDGANSKQAKKKR
jgi:hypothetical protein